MHLKFEGHSYIQWLWFNQIIAGEGFFRARIMQGVLFDPLLVKNERLYFLTCPKYTNR